MANLAECDQRAIWYGLRHALENSTRVLRFFLCLAVPCVHYAFPKSRTCHFVLVLLINSACEYGWFCFRWRYHW